MSQWNSYPDDRNKEDPTQPPYSRIFVVCNKQTEDDLRSAFQEFGEIESIYMPKDRNSGELKGVAFIKYTKTSSAAAAIDALHMKTLKNGKYVKVMVALSKQDDPYSENTFKYKRLFIKVSKDATEEEISKHFNEFGKVVSVRLQKDRDSNMCKGFAYVTFASFYDTALAYENCSKEYKPVFATPKDDQKRYRNNLESDMYSGYSGMNRDHFHASAMFKQTNHFHQQNSGLMQSNISNLDNITSILVTCQPPVPQRHIERLFDLLPGMIKCEYKCDAYNGVCRVTITYENKKAAANAVDKLDGFDFPSGEILSVKFDSALNKAADKLNNIVDNIKSTLDSGNPDLCQLAEAIANASALIKVAAEKKIAAHSDCEYLEFCSEPLPPRQPLANANSTVAVRCFIVCKPYPPPLKVLTDIFSRFGDLIEVSLLPAKNYGFVKYASKRSADEAVSRLNDLLVCGSKLKVVLASEKLKDPKEEPYGTVQKRIRLDS